MRSVNNRIGFGLVIWVSLLAFFSQATVLPARQEPWNKTTLPARFVPAKRTGSIPAVPAIVLAQAEEFSDDLGKTFLTPTIASGFTFHARFFQLPAGNLFCLLKRSASTPLYLWHCLFRI